MAYSKNIVPFTILGPTSQKEQFKLTAIIQKVLAKKRYVAGGYLTQFESDFATFVGSKHAMGCNSGTDALVLGIQALGIQKGKEVILTPNTFYSAAYAIIANGLKPVFVDINPATYGFDLADLQNKITKNTAAIIATHLYGQPEDMDGIRHVIKAAGHPIHMIEDACQAHGAWYKDKRVGSLGTFAAFSFYPTKNLGALGDGGAFTTNDASLAKRFRLLCNYGQTDKYHHEILGTNSRLDELQAALLIEKLKTLDFTNQKRRKVADLYHASLNTCINVLLPPVFGDRKSVYHLFVIQAKRRDQLQSHLAKRGVQTLIHYPIPLHLQKALMFLGHKKGDFPSIERISKSIVSLPLSSYHTNDQVQYVCQAIKDFYET